MNVGKTQTFFINAIDFISQFPDGNCNVAQSRDFLKIDAILYVYVFLHVIKKYFCLSFSSD